MDSSIAGEKIRYFDAYAKPQDDYAERTVTGGFLSLISMFVIFLLTLVSFADMQHIRTVSQLTVDKSRHERLSINVNVTFPSIPCHLLNLDVMDVAGEQQNDLDRTTSRVRLDKLGRFISEEIKRKDTVIKEQCGHCYGAEPPASGCCNTCAEVREAYKMKGWALDKVEDVQQCVSEGWADELDFDKGEGCMVTARTTVNRVSGNFHFIPGKSYQQSNMHVHHIQNIMDRLHEFDFGHRINHVSFGQEFEGMVSPLDGLKKHDGSAFFQYFIKVVPTKVIYLNGTEILTNQYSVTQFESKAEEGRVPGIFFNYDISPMQVIYRQERKPFSTFFTELCAIIGGIYTITALIDTAFYRAERAMRIKRATGKAN